MPLQVIESLRQKHLYVLSKWTPEIFAVRLCQALLVAGCGGLVDKCQVFDTLISRTGTHSEAQASPL